MAGRDPVCETSVLVRGVLRRRGESPVVGLFDALWTERFRLVTSE